MKAVVKIVLKTVLKTQNIKIYLILLVWMHVQLTYNKLSLLLILQKVIMANVFIIVQMVIINHLLITLV